MWKNRVKLGLRVLAMTLVVVVVLIWMASWFRYFYAAATSGDYGLSIHVAKGSVNLLGQKGLLDFQSWFEIIDPSDVPNLCGPASPRHEFWGVAWEFRVSRSPSLFMPGTHTLLLVVPGWLTAAILLMVGLLVTTPWRWSSRRARCARGLCESCGYDLRMSQDRCPECGQAFARD